MPLYLDYREGSIVFALMEPLRSLLDDCPYCDGTPTLSPLNPTHYIGHRKSKKGGSKHCRKCYGTGKSFLKLNGADCCFSGKCREGECMVGVEIKTVEDFVGSLYAGRFQGRQLPALLNDYTYSWVLIYGERRRCPRTGALQVYKRVGRSFDWFDVKLGTITLPSTYLDNFMTTPPVVETGIRFKEVRDKKEAAQWLYDLYMSWTKPYEHHKSLEKFDTTRDIQLGRVKTKKVQGESGIELATNPLTYRPENNEAIIEVANVANKPPGMGYRRAMAAAVHFRSIKKMVNASVEDWTKVSFKQGKRTAHIGKTVAESIVKYFERTAPKF